FTSATGIGDYDLKSSDDQVFAFDYDSSGHLDHLVLYRPGGGSIFIIENNQGSFSPVFTSAADIGGYNLLSSSDRASAFDYTSTGKLDHLVLYRPGTGAIFILKKNSQGNFSAVYQQGDPGDGIGGYDLKSSDDQAFAFDYNSTSKLDHLVLYRPG